MQKTIGILFGVVVCIGLLTGWWGNSPERIQAKYRNAMEKNDVKQLVAITASDELNIEHLNNVRDKDNNNIMIMALLKKKSPEVIAGLIQAGFDVSRHAPIMEIREWDKRSILTVAIESGYKAPVIQLLLEKGAWYSLDNISGLTPFQAALKKNDIEIIKLLLYCLKNDNRRLGDAFEATLAARNTEVLLLLFDNFRIPAHWFFPLAERCKSEEFDLILKIFTPEARTRLLSQCMQHLKSYDEKQVEFLLARGALPEGILLKQTGWLKTQSQDRQLKWLKLAFQEDNITLLSLFIKNGFDADSVDKNGKSLLMYAAESCGEQQRNVKNIYYLIDIGADPLYRERQGKRASDYAQNHVIKNFLLEAEMEIESPSIHIPPWQRRQPPSLRKKQMQNRQTKTPEGILEKW